MANIKELKPYGTWSSLISPEFPGNLLEFSELAWTDEGYLLWRERSSNHAALRVWHPDKKEIKYFSQEINIGGGILYGGGSFTVYGDKIAIVEKGSNQLFLGSIYEQTFQKLTSTLVRSASPRFSPSGDTLAFVHSDGEIDTIKALNISSSRPPHTLVSGSDFYNYIRWHPDGSHLAWISWDHPHMPWDSSRLWLAQVHFPPGEFPQLDEEAQIAGGEGISVVQPEFSPDGHYLAYVSDQTGWWQIHIYNLESGEHRQLTHTEAEHAIPPWLQEQCSYGFSKDSQRIYFLRNTDGFSSLWQLDLESGEESRITIDEVYTWMESLAISPRGNRITVVASGGNLPQQILSISPNGDSEVIQRSTSVEFSRELFSLPKAISWQDPQGETVHGIFYLPHNPAYQGDGEPPLLIIIHSGPTRQKWFEFQPRAQYFTSRGYAVLEINYRGSTGYGRHYWERLKGEWGIVDVADVISGAKFLSGEGWVDPDRIVLLGSSSGGLTVLQLLVAYPGVFRAGVTLYGVTNHLTLIKNPSKFERYYSEWLLGPYPEAAEIYQSRSPLFHADRIRDPVAVFQGGKDPIVPLDQAEQLIAVLQKNGVPHEYHLYPEEGHGFKRFENVRDFYHKTDAFLRKYVIKT